MPGEEHNKSTERTLSITKDDYGTSYYFRGKVEDNYVTFSGKCWRIVRIQGDGSIKLILQDNNAVCSSSTDQNSLNASIGEGIYGYASFYPDYIKYTESSAVRKKIETWINNGNNFSTANLNLLKEEIWCLDADPTLHRYGYASHSFWGNERLSEHKNPTLKCDDNNVNIASKDFKTIKAYSALLTADEVAFAGISGHGTFSLNWEPYNYLFNTNINTWLTLTPATYGDSYKKGGTVFGVCYIVNSMSYTPNIEADMCWSEADVEYYIRPAIVLKSGVQIKGGSGTKNDPYIIKNE